MTLPTGKAGGFSVQRPQPAPARSYMVSTSVRFRCVPPYHRYPPAGAALHARCSLRHLHPGHGQCRRRGKPTLARTNPLCRAIERRKRSIADWMERSTVTSCFPYHPALYSNCRRNSPQEASEIDRATLILASSRRLLPFDFRDSCRWSLASFFWLGAYGWGIPYHRR